MTDHVEKIEQADAVAWDGSHASFRLVSLWAMASGARDVVLDEGDPDVGVPRSIQVLTGVGEVRVIDGDLLVRQGDGHFEVAGSGNWPHHLSVTIERNGDVWWEITCTASVGDPCRMWCDEGCESDGGDHDRHTLRDQGTCGRAPFFEDGSLIPELYEGPRADLRSGPVVLSVSPDEGSWRYALLEDPPASWSNGYAIGYQDGTGQAYGKDGAFIESEGPYRAP